MGEAKRKRQQPPSPPKHLPGDAEIVLLSADGFMACSRPFREKVAKLGIEEAIQAGRKDKGGMVASAVNLAFSVELYLKALRIIHTVPPSRTHDLGQLYGELPRQVRQSLETEYKRVPKPDSTIISLGMSITHKDAPPEEQASKADSPTDHSIRAVLRRSSRVFEVWRYLYDQGEPGKVKRLLYEFHFLGVAADVLHEHVTGGLQLRH